MPSPTGEAPPAVSPGPHSSPWGLQMAQPSHLQKEPEETDPLQDLGLNYTTEEGEGLQA